MLAHLWQQPMPLLWLPPAFWAGNLVLGRALGAVYPPVSLAVGRWVVALAALAPFVAAAAWRQRALIRAHWKVILACGAFGIAGYNALGYLALQTSPAANVAFINSTLPLMVPIAAAALGVEKARPRTILGITVSFVGVAWIISRGDLAALRTLDLADGDLLVLVAVANYAIYSALLRLKPAAIDPLVFLAATMAAGLLVLMPFWAVELAHGAHIPFDIASIGAVVYIGVFASLVSFILWNRCVAVLGATVTGISFHLVAVFTAALAWAVLGEPISGFHLVGIALILAGFAIATRRAALLPRTGAARP